MISMIALFISKFIPLQVGGGATAQTSPYIIYPVIGAILIIIILAIRVYIIEKRKAQS